MTQKLTSKEPIPLARNEYLDCPNVCNSRKARWHKGNAICPECGGMACVYDGAAFFRTSAASEIMSTAATKPKADLRQQHRKGLDEFNYSANQKIVLQA